MQPVFAIIDCYFASIAAVVVANLLLLILCSRRKQLPTGHKQQRTWAYVLELVDLHHPHCLHWKNHYFPVGDPNSDGVSLSLVSLGLWMEYKGVVITVASAKTKKRLFF